MNLNNVDNSQTWKSTVQHQSSSPPNNRDRVINPVVELNFFVSPFHTSNEQLYINSCNHCWLLTPNLSSFFNPPFVCTAPKPN